MAPLKQPKSLCKTLTEYLKELVLNLVEKISIDDEDGCYNKQSEKYLTNIQEYMEPWLPVQISSELIEVICKDHGIDTAMKYAAFYVLHSPERSKNLMLGK